MCRRDVLLCNAEIKLFVTKNKLFHGVSGGPGQHDKVWNSCVYFKEYTDVRLSGPRPQIGAISIYVFTYVSVDFLVILHFSKVHVIHHQRLPHGEFTLGQHAQHPLILRKPVRKFHQGLCLKAILNHTFKEILGDKGWGRGLCNVSLPFLRGPRRVAPFGETLQQNIDSTIITSTVPVNKKTFTNNFIWKYG